MKIAVLSDIHGNFPALEAVTSHIEGWKPDLVYVAGDIVNRGPRSQECLRFLDQKQRDDGWQIIRGNHEDYVIHQSIHQDNTCDPRYEIHQPVLFTIKQLDGDVSKLKSLPEKITNYSLEYGEIRMVHASMRHNRDGIYPETRDYKLQQQIAPAPRVFITGHTHRPFVKLFDGSLVVNVGSVGLPFDGDQRAAYAQITWQKKQWGANIVRLNYDIEQAERDFYETGYLDGGGPLSAVVLLELKSALSQLYQWSARYAKRIMAKTITIAESTTEFLTEPIQKPYW